MSPIQFQAAIQRPGQNFQNVEFRLESSAPNEWQVYLESEFIFTATNCVPLKVSCQLMEPFTGSAKAFCSSSTLPVLLPGSRQALLSGSLNRLADIYPDAEIYAPWVLVPVGSAVSLPHSLSEDVALLVPPVAAALAALRFTPPVPEEPTAILGLRQYGLALQAVLEHWTNCNHHQVTSSVLADHSHLLVLGAFYGACKGIHCDIIATGALDASYNLVFAASGSVQELQHAFKLSKNHVHVLHSMSRDALQFLGIDDACAFQGRQWTLRSAEHFQLQGSESILLAPQVAVNQLPVGFQNATALSWKDARNNATNAARTKADPSEGFQVAVVSNLHELNTLLTREHTLLADNATLIIAPNFEEGPLRDHINRNIILATSSANNANEALAWLGQHPQLAQSLLKDIISHRIPFAEIERASQVLQEDKSATGIVITYP